MLLTGFSEEIALGQPVLVQRLSMLVISPPSTSFVSEAGPISQQFCSNAWVSKAALLGITHVCSPA